MSVERAQHLARNVADRHIALGITNCKHIWLGRLARRSDGSRAANFGDCIGLQIVDGGNGIVGDSDSNLAIAGENCVVDTAIVLIKGLQQRAISLPKTRRAVLASRQDHRAVGRKTRRNYIAVMPRKCGYDIASQIPRLRRRILHHHNVEAVGRKFGKTYVDSLVVGLKPLADAPRADGVVVANSYNSLIVRFVRRRPDVGVVSLQFFFERTAKSKHPHNLVAARCNYMLAVRRKTHRIDPLVVSAKSHKFVAVEIPKPCTVVFVAEVVGGYEDAPAVGREYRLTYHRHRKLRVFIDR